MKFFLNLPFAAIISHAQSKAGIANVKWVEIEYASHSHILQPIRHFF